MLHRLAIFYRLASCLGALTLAMSVRAQPVLPDELRRVEITGKAGPLEEHPYADLLDAVTLFASWQNSHPGTQLRFRVQPRKDPAAGEGLEVYIADPVDHTRTLLPLAPGGRFELPVEEEARVHHASVRTNRPDGTLAWSVEITHEGDDEHVRRLGDLREECYLDLYAATLVRGIKPPAFYASKRLTNLCTSRLLGWGTYADHPIFAVHIDEGSRHGSLLGDNLHGGDASMIPLGALLDWTGPLRDSHYFVHTLMADAAWSDEARLRLVFADDPPQSDGAIGGSSDSPSQAPSIDGGVR